jgi:uncharacterized protein YndB with AHSA1/START domain
MGRISASLSLPYPAARVWAVATRIGDLPKWMPEVVDARLLDPQLAVDAKAWLKLSAAAAGAEVTGTVRVLDVPHRLEIAGSGGPIGVVVRVTLRDGAADTTEAKVEVELETPPFLGFIANEAERRIQAGLPGALERLRALIEAEPA